MFLPELINELTAVGDAALILDDFHRLTSGPARDSVAWFVDRAPSTFQLVLATRNEPALPLAAMRAHGELLEVRARGPRLHSGRGRRAAERSSGARARTRVRPRSRRAHRGLAGRALPRGALAAGSRRPARVRAPGSAAGAATSSTSSSTRCSTHTTPRCRSSCFAPRSSSACAARCATRCSNSKAPTSCWTRSPARTCSSCRSTIEASGTASITSSPAAARRARAPRAGPRADASPPGIRLASRQRLARRGDRACARRPARSRKRAS